MTSTAITKRESILATVERYKDEMTALAPPRTNPDRFLAALRLYFAQMPQILDCAPASVAQGMLRVAQTGLELGVTCYLVPYGQKCQFVSDYKGLIELAIKSGARKVEYGLVREGDVFEFEHGTRQFLRHVPLMQSKAPITHAWAMAEVKPASYIFVVLTRDEIEAVRGKYSKQWKSGNLDDIGWYATKTAVRRLMKMLPQNTQLAKAMLFDEADEQAPAPFIEEEVTKAPVAEGDETFEVQGDPEED